MRDMQVPGRRGLLVAAIPLAALAARSGLFEAAAQGADDGALDDIPTLRPQERIQVAALGVTVQRGPTFDGIGQYMAD